MWFSVVATAMDLAHCTRSKSSPFEIWSGHSSRDCDCYGECLAGLFGRLHAVASSVARPRLRRKGHVCWSTNQLLRFGRHPLALVLIGLLLVLGQLGRDRLHTNTDPFRFFPADHLVVRALHALEDFGVTPSW